MLTHRVAGQDAPAALRPFEKYERTATDAELGLAGKHSPYDPADVRVDAQIILPDGEVRTQPCFWLVPSEPYYVRKWSEDGRRDVEWERFRPAGPGRWCLRFAPDGAGRYRYSFVVASGGHQWEKPGGEFQCGGPAQPACAPVRLRAGGRCFEHTDGRLFVPVGQNLGWPEESGSRIYATWLGRLAQSGANCARLWLVHYIGGTGLEWSPTPVNAGYRGVGTYSEESAARVDRILDAARDNGIYLILSFYSFGDTNWDWEANPYSTGGGGWLNDPREFFTDERARAATRNALRYAVARYGWSANVWAWELWNEVETSDGYEREAVTAWHAEMAAYLKRTDGHHRLITTSYRFTPPTTACDAYGLKEIDFVNVHSYRPWLTDVFPWRVADVRPFGKPVLISEYGIDVRPNYFDADPAGLHLHDGLWTGVFCGSAGGAMAWWWERYVHPRDLYFHYTGISRFLAGEDLGKYAPVECEARGEAGAHFAFALKSDKGVLAWVGARRQVGTADGDPYGTVTSYSCAAAGGPLELRIPGAAPGTYTVALYDTFDGIAVRGPTVVCDGAALVVPVPGFRHDVALKCVVGGGGAEIGNAGSPTPIHDRFDKLFPNTAPARE